MTLLDPIAAESLREASIPVLETERLVLRAPRPEDAENIAMLANERRIAENTARIPHPYTLADAEAFLAAANRSDRETTFVIALSEGTLIGACGLELREGPGTAGLMPELGCSLPASRSPLRRSSPNQCASLYDLDHRGGGAASAGSVEHNGTRVAT